MKTKSILKKISLSIISLIIVIIIIELILRVLGESVPRYTKDDSDFIIYDSLVNYTYMKNLNQKIENKNYSINVSTNSFGYWDNEWKFNKDKNRILIIGDSFSAGYGIEKSKRFSDLISEEFSNSVKIYNAAVSGYNLEQMKITAKNLLNVINPKIIVVGLNINSLSRLYDPYIYNRGFSLKKSKEKLAQIYGDKLVIHNFENKFLQYLEKHLLLNSVFYNFSINRLRILKNIYVNHSSDADLNLIDLTKSHLSELISISRNSNIELIVLPIIQHESKSKFSNLNIEYYNIIHSFCFEKKIIFVDLLPTLNRELESGANFWINNDSHWNAIAHRIAANKLLENIFFVEN